MKAIFVSQFEPKPYGHGGNHRAYQIAYDLAQIVGEENVISVSWPLWQQACPVKSKTLTTSSSLAALRRLGHNIVPLRTAIKIWRRLPFLFVDHPTKLLAGTGPTTKRYSNPEFTGCYEQIVRDISHPAVCIIEHVGFSNLLPINSRYGIPTISCIANIESLDRFASLSCEEGKKPYNTAVDFADELGVLAQCDARLCISKVETGLLGGLGLSSRYYPYLPVGKIRQNLKRIRQARIKGDVKSGLFLMVGTAGHATTRESFLWFVQNARKYGLPSGVRVVIVGYKTDKLLSPGTLVPGLEGRGWLQQDELDKLLIHAQAVLIPQTVGFGALTRLPELSYTGIPVVVSKHPTYAIDPPPGLEIVDDDWETWCIKMKQVTNNANQLNLGDYKAWEKDQANLLKVVIQQQEITFSAEARYNE